MRNESEAERWKCERKIAVVVVVAVVIVVVVVST